MSEIYRVENIEKAIELAQEFKVNGKYNLFRGQARNWSVKSTMGRLTSESERNQAIEKLKRLYYYLGNYKSSTKYIEDIDWFFAVAQHYGLPTAYIDFSFDVEVSAFFATNSTSNEVNEDSVILCLNETDFDSVINATIPFFQKERVVPPYIVKPNVDNLWRLQSQSGCFIFSSFSEIEKIYDFDKIVFPFKEKFEGKSLELIYPNKKSELEILLDQFFNAEKRMEGSARLDDFIKENNINHLSIPKTNSSLSLKINAFHNSWENEETKDWFFKTNHKWDINHINLSLILIIDERVSFKEQFINLSNYLSSLLYEDYFLTKRLLTFKIDSGCEAKVNKLLSESCSRIWEGVLNLPYTIENIIKIISKYILIEYHFQKYDNVISINDDNLVVLEMTNNYGSITRCYASEENIISAFREDIDDVLIDSLKGNYSSKILLHINEPQYIFDFKKMIDLFINDLIPYQVYYNSENKEPVIFYTPTQLKIVGYA